MKKAMGVVVLAAFLALPAMAQDEAAPPAEETAPAADAGAAAEEAAPATEDAASASEDTSAAEAVTSGDAAPSEASTTSEDTTSTVGADEASASSDDDGGGGGGGSGRTFYVGLEYDMTKVDLNDKGTREALGRRHFESNFYKLRLGARIFEGVGLELHAGFPDNDASSRKLETKQFYGVYLVPTGVLFDLVEVSARLGYAYTELESELGKDDADGASFGLAVELPLRHFGEGMPNLRIGAGGTVYQEEREGRVFGWHGGIRYDFTL